MKQGHEPFLELRSCSIGYGLSEVLHAVSLTVRKGEVVGLIGSNGSGKTTLFRALAGDPEIRLFGGKILLFGALVDRRERVWERIGRGLFLCAQSPFILEDRTVLENVLVAGLSSSRARPSLLRSFLPGASNGLPGGIEEARERIEEAGLMTELSKLAGELSEGQRRRLAIAMALQRSSRLILLDEPTASLDLAAKHELMNLLAGLKGEDRTFLIADHDRSFLTGVCDRYFSFGNGKVEEGVLS